MKKVIFSLLLFFSTTCLYAQDLVAGVFFGESYENAKKTLDKRFHGGEDSYQPDRNEINYYEISFGGENFDHAGFVFQTDGTYTYLSFMSFQKRFELNELKEAKEMRDRLSYTYYSKYKNIHEDIDDKGFKYYILSKEDNGKFDITISLTKDKNKKGNMKYWVIVSYGPEYAIDPSDEI